MPARWWRFPLAFLLLDNRIVYSYFRVNQHEIIYLHVCQLGDQLEVQWFNDKGNKEFINKSFILGDGVVEIKCSWHLMVLVFFMWLLHNTLKLLVYEGHKFLSSSPKKLGK